MAYPFDWEQQLLTELQREDARGGRGASEASQWVEPIRRRRSRGREVSHHGIPGADNRWFPSREQARKAALQAATALGPGHRIVWDDANRPGQQPHYHVVRPDGARVSGHFFYGRQVTRRMEHPRRPAREAEWEAEAPGPEFGPARYDLRAALQAELESSSAMYEVIGADTRILVTNTTAVPFRYIVNIEENGTAICTGTLIGPSTVLTAGHCLDGTDLANTRVVPGRDGAKEPLGSAKAKSFHLAPGYASGTATDYGVIHLDTPIGNKVGFWGIAFRRGAGDKTGTSISSQALPQKVGVLKVNLSGYPGDKPKTPPPPKGTEQWLAFDRTCRVSAGLLHYVNDTFAGHSGSPVWVRRSPDHGGRVMVGIHIGGAGKSNVAVRITPGVMANIVNWLAAAPTPPTPPAAARPVLRRGSRGPAVVEAQTRLNAWIVGTPGSGISLLDTDGVFGASMDIAVKAFKRANGLTVDGIIDAKTWAALPPIS